MFSTQDAIFEPKFSEHVLQFSHTDSHKWQNNFFSPGDHGDTVPGPAAGGIRQQRLVLHIRGCQGLVLDLVF